MVRYLSMLFRICYVYRKGKHMFASSRITKYRIFVANLKFSFSGCHIIVIIHNVWSERNKYYVFPLFFCVECDGLFIIKMDVRQKQTAVAAYWWSEKLLLFVFAD